MKTVLAHERHHSEQLWFLPNLPCRDASTSETAEPWHQDGLVVKRP